MACAAYTTARYALQHVAVSIAQGLPIPARTDVWLACVGDLLRNHRKEAVDTCANLLRANAEAIAPLMHAQRIMFDLVRCLYMLVTDPRCEHTHLRNGLSAMLAYSRAGTAYREELFSHPLMRDTVLLLVTHVREDMALVMEAIRAFQLQRDVSFHWLQERNCGGIYNVSRIEFALELLAHVREEKDVELALDRMSADTFRNLALYRRESLSELASEASLWLLRLLKREEAQEESIGIYLVTAGRLKLLLSLATLSTWSENDHGLVLYMCKRLHVDDVLATGILGADAWMHCFSEEAAHVVHQLGQAALYESGKEEESGTDDDASSVAHTPSRKGSDVTDSVVARLEKIYSYRNVGLLLSALLVLKTTQTVEMVQVMVRLLGRLGAEVAWTRLFSGENRRMWSSARAVMQENDVLREYMVQNAFSDVVRQMKRSAACAAEEGGAC